MYKALTVAGSDSGGGAGIQADLKTFAALEVYGTSALTAVTAQNTAGVQGVVELQPEFVAQQMDAVLADIGADAVKTGMLASAPIVRAVAAKIREYGIRRLVIDPVMVAKGGDHLLQPSAVGALKDELLPLGLVVTPNLAEAEVLTGLKVRDIEEMQAAAAALHALGAANVVVKGGHLEGDAIDLLYDGKEFTALPAPRIPTKNTHGTGCTFSAAVAAGLARGLPVPAAVAQAKAFITGAISEAFPVGSGHGPTHHFWALYRDSRKHRVLENLRQAAEALQRAGMAHLIPETQSNLALATEDAKDASDVAAIPGRLIKCGNEVKTVAAPAFGSSRSLAGMVLTLMRHDPQLRAVMNIRYSEANLKACLDLGLQPVEFVWPDPAGGGPSLSFDQILAEYRTKNGRMPDLVFNRGGWGKEAHIELFGTDALTLAATIGRIAVLTRAN